MKVNQLARELRTSADTVRFYTRIGLLKPRRNPDNGYKEYREEDRRRLRFILNARQLGFTVEDIAQLLGDADKGRSPCPQVRRLIEQRLEENRRRIEESVALQRRMEAAVDKWRCHPDKPPTGEMICHLIEDFESA